MRFTPILLALLLFACTPSIPPEVGKADELRKSGQLAQALIVLSDAEKKSPNDPAILQSLGFALIDAQQWKEASTLFDRLIAQQPRNAEGYNGKAVTLDHLKQHKEAQKLYDKALELSPEAVNIQNNKSMSLILTGEYKKAVAMLEPLNEKSSSKTIRSNLALAYAMSGEKQKALDLNLVDLSPEQAAENMRFYEQYAKEKSLRLKAKGLSKRSSISPKP